MITNIKLNFSKSEDKQWTKIMNTIIMMKKTMR